MAYLIKIIKYETKEQFHIIREIRNRFAHRLDAADFDSNIISDLCRKLFRPHHIESMLTNFENNIATYTNNSDIAPLEFILAPLKELPDTPRNAYLSTIKLNLFVMEIGTEFALKDAGVIEDGLVLGLPSPSQEKYAEQLRSRYQNVGHVPRKRVRRQRPSPV